MSGKPKIPPAEFFSNTAELKIFEYLLKRPNHSVLVCDTSFSTYLATRLHEDKIHMRPGFVCWQDIESSPRESLHNYSNFFVCSLEHEKDILTTLRSVFPRKNIFGLVSDVATCLAAGTTPWSERNNNTRLAEETQRLKKIILVFSVARSGSTYLSELITSSNLCGPIKEDLRPHLCYLVQSREIINFDLQKWLTLLIQKNTREGIFATKIIAHFLFDIIKYFEHDELHVILNTLSTLNTHIIHLYRLDKVKQAISAYFANQVNFWHIVSEYKKMVYQKKTENVEYNFDDLYKLYQFNQKHEQLLSNFLGSIQCGSSQIVYEDLVKSPADFLQRLAKDAGLEKRLELDKACSRQHKTPDHKSGQFAERFRQELANKHIK